MGLTIQFNFCKKKKNRRPERGRELPRTEIVSLLIQVAKVGGRVGQFLPEAVNIGPDGVPLGLSLITVSKQGGELLTGIGEGSKAGE